MSQLTIFKHENVVVWVLYNYTPSTVKWCQLPDTIYVNKYAAHIACWKDIVIKINTIRTHTLPKTHRRRKRCYNWMVEGINVFDNYTSWVIICIDFAPLSELSKIRLATIILCLFYSTRYHASMWFALLHQIYNVQH